MTLATKAKAKAIKRTRKSRRNGKEILKRKMIGTLTHSLIYSPYSLTLLTHLTHSPYSFTYSLTYLLTY